MKHWKLSWIALSVSAVFSVHVAYAANPISQQQVNDLFCNSNLPIPSNLCPTSSPTARNPASQQYVCERYVAMKGSSVPVKIGDVVGNGIVYYIDNVSRRGLIAAQTDAPVPAGGVDYPWATSTSLVGGTKAFVFTGTSNTNILNGLGITNFPAAQAARAYPAPACPSTITCDPSYSLPSLNELSLLYPFNNKAVRGFTDIGLVGFSDVPTGRYWSSTEYNANNAWFVLITTGRINTFDKVTNPRRVRPVRAFSY